ncbi:MAG TPA: IS701 family transposase [Candidatus Sulfotelmatobacter sp.]|jgi:SRSO17 transposase|nr:IS701 family transposase [Candidatus Sulfotelmatobacter sp.]
MEGLATAAGHEDRHAPLKNYCKGLLLPGERKSIEPMAARLEPGDVQAMRQSLHHLVAKAPWSDDLVLEQVRDRVMPAMEKHGPVVAWIVDDTGFPKKGRHSVGVARQYCGQVGKQDNCRVAVSLSVATWSSSLPIFYRLYLPKEWAEDAERREKTEVPVAVEFQTKPEIAMGQIRAAAAAQVARGTVLADAAYGINTDFRDGLNELGLQYVLGVQSSMTVWEPGKQPLPAKARGKTGRPPRLLQRTTDHQPVSVKHLAMNLPSTAFSEITWREGTNRKLQSRFAAVRVRPAHRDYWKAEPYAEEWLLIEWPRGEAEPAKYWISTLPSGTKLKELIKMAKHRWIIERDYEELKQELGLGHFEGRNWRGFHHHATLCIAAYGFLVAERNRFSPSARAGHLGFVARRQVPHFSPRGSPRTPRAA